MASEQLTRIRETKNPILSGSDYDFAKDLYETRKSRTPKGLTPEEESGYISQYGNSAQTYLILNKAIQEKEMYGKVLSNPLTFLSPGYVLPGGVFSPQAEQESLAKVREQLGTGEFNKGIPSQSSVKEITTQGAPTLPVNTSGDIVAKGTGATTAGANTIADLQKSIDALSAQQPSTETQQEKKSILDLIKKREDTKATQKTAVELRQEALTQAYSEMGVTPEQIQKIGGLIGEITSYNQQLADLDAKKQAALERVEGMGMSNTYISGEQNRLSRAYNSEIAAKSAQAGVKVQELQMIQGAYDDAKATASQIVNLMTYDQQQEVADIEWSLSAHQDLYNLMSGEEKEMWDRQYTMAKDKLNRLTDEKTKVSNLMLETNGKAGILITDTLDSAVQKASAWQGKQTTAPETQGDYYWDAKTGTWKSISGASGGKEWTDIQIKTALNTLISNGATIDELYQEIDSDTTIFNKDRAKQIAKQLLQQTTEASGGETVQQAQQREQAQSKRKELAKTTTQTGSLGFIDPETGAFISNSNAEGDFFSNLFAK